MTGSSPGVALELTAPELDRLLRCIDYVDHKFGIGPERAELRAKVLAARQTLPGEIRI